VSEIDYRDLRPKGRPGGGDERRATPSRRKDDLLRELGLSLLPIDHLEAERHFFAALGTGESAYPNGVAEGLARALGRLTGEDPGEIRARAAVELELERVTGRAAVETCREILRATTILGA
jgi:hypothetical protein